MSTKSKFIEDILPFAKTDRQREVLNAVIKHGSMGKAGKALGIDRTTVRDSVGAVKRNAERRGFIAQYKTEGTAPPGFYAETSTMRKLNPETGEMEVVMDWTKSKLDGKMQEESFRQILAGLSADLIPAKAKTFKLKNYSTELASAIIFGDAHIGMLAHAIETLGEDHDLESATADIRYAIDYLVDTAPASETGWFINVGDLMHVNGTANTTFSGTKQDVSANHNQVMRAAGATLRYCIDRMLDRFKNVVVINARGNHDKDPAFALNFYLEGVYENEPRVEVQGNDSKFNFLEFGKCLVGVHHGDGINANRLAGTMTKQAAEAWGRTTFRRFWIGHIHHKTMQEHDSGVTIESFHTLAPLDAWHSASGYGAEQRVTMITLHKDFGEVNRTAPSLEMIRAIANG